MARNSETSAVKMAVTLLIATFVTSHLLVTVSARYLPTRSQDDRLDKLRELLKDLLESGDMERNKGPGSGIDYGEIMVPSGIGGRPLIYKRSTGPYFGGKDAHLLRPVAGGGGSGLLHPDLRKGVMD